LAVNHEGAEILACDERIHFEQQINWQNFGRVALRCKKNFLELLIIPLACLPGWIKFQEPLLTNLSIIA
jgi:hypothetical protein